MGASVHPLVLVKFMWEQVEVINGGGGVKKGLLTFNNSFQQLIFDKSF
jgi:hypothetical protein